MYGKVIDRLGGENPLWICMKNLESLRKLIENNYKEHYCLLLLGIFICIIGAAIFFKGKNIIQLDSIGILILILGFIVIIGSLIKPKKPKDNTNTEESINNKPSGDNAGIGYQVAVDLWAYEGASVWSRFNAMVLANSIFFAGIILLVMDNGSYDNFIKLMTIAGILLCILWFLLNERGFSYHNYYISSARELEKDLPGVKIVKDGQKFSDGEELKIDGSEIHMSFWGKIGAKAVSRCMIFLFLAMYSIIFLTLLLGKLNV